MPELLKVDEAAERLKVHPETLYRAIRRGDLQAGRVGRCLRVSDENLTKYLDRSAGNGLAAVSAN
jgi:excisionase family DNA binding protein